MYKFFLPSFVRYILVGALNTLVTAVIIFFLMKTGISIYISNLFGYIFGVLFSFFMNSRFTFQVACGLMNFIKFIISFILCYTLNIITVYFILKLSSGSSLTAQASGMFIYTVSGFLINKLWVMKND